MTEENYTAGLFERQGSVAVFSQNLKGLSESLRRIDTLTAKPQIMKRQRCGIYKVLGPLVDGKNIYCRCSKPCEDKHILSADTSHKKYQVCGADNSCNMKTSERSLGFVKGGLL